MDGKTVEGAERLHVVLLEPDVARVFKDSASVNRVFRFLGNFDRNFANRIGK